MPKAEVWRIDGIPLETSPQIITGQLLATVPDLEFRSIEALQQLLIGLFDLSIEMAIIERATVKGAIQGALTRHITATRKQLQYIPEEREKLLTVVFDKILQCEGLGLLVGFGFVPRGNAERESTVAQIYEYQNEKEKIMATKKKEDTKIKRSELIAAAKEMNIILEPDPEIGINLPSNELIAVLANAKELLEPTDPITPATKKVLAGLPKVEEFAALVEKEATENVPPVEKGIAEKGIAAIEKAPTVADKKKAEALKKKEMAAAAAKKVEAPDKKEPTGKNAIKRQGIGVFVRSILSTQEGNAKSNIDIITEVLQKFPTANTKPANIAWYRNAMKKKN